MVKGAGVVRLSLDECTGSHRGVCSDRVSIVTGAVSGALGGRLGPLSCNITAGHSVRHWSLTRQAVCVLFNPCSVVVTAPLVVAGVRLGVPV